MSTTTLTPDGTRRGRPPIRKLLTQHPQYTLLQQQLDKLNNDIKWAKLNIARKTRAIDIRKSRLEHSIPGEIAMYEEGIKNEEATLASATESFDIQWAKLNIARKRRAISIRHQRSQQMQKEMIEFSNGIEQEALRLDQLEAEREVRMEDFKALRTRLIRKIRRKLFGKENYGSCPSAHSPDNG